MGVQGNVPFAVAGSRRSKNRQRAQAARCKEGTQQQLRLTFTIARIIAYVSHPAVIQKVLKLLVVLPTYHTAYDGRGYGWCPLRLPHRMRQRSGAVLSPMGQGGFTSGRSGGL